MSIIDKVEETNLGPMSERPDFPKLEKEILEFWRKNKIFKKTLEKPAPRGNFVFFEGPPTANGKPGLHHVEGRAYKDVIPRFRTMQGYLVERKAGWDTHGLPVELAIEKELNVSGKPQIETLKDTPQKSIAYFNQLCRQSVWRHLADWNNLTERLGFWLDLEAPYITYETPYIESVWWFIQQAYEKKLLERDYKVVHFCPRCQTPLSSHEVALGYRDDAVDPSIFVRFVLTKESADRLGLPLGSAFLVWTTTPWTLPGNGALAIHPEIEYAIVHHGESRLLLAKPLIERVLGPNTLIVRTLRGQELAGLRYEPLYPRIDKKEYPEAYQALTADFVSLDEGTGIVHIAPAFGEEDFTFKTQGIPPHFSVNERGIMDQGLPGAGKFIKEADRDIQNDLKQRGLLFREETIKHTYPFCWRCDTPLLYYARASWFIQMSRLREAIRERNQTINWIPEYIKEGRFGEWLRELKDWAITRERYWGAPLPIWQCDQCNQQEVIGSLTELYTRGRRRNRYFLMRHGESASNLQRLISSKLETSEKYLLTQEGRERVTQAAEKLKDQGITKILASPFYRMRQTAEIVSIKLNRPIEYCFELQEIDLPDFDGRPTEEYEQLFANIRERFTKKIGQNETWEELAQRLLSFLAKYDRAHENETVLICSHGDPLFLLQWAASGLTREGIKQIPYPNFDAPAEFTFDSQLVNDQGELDLHRPLIDAITWPCGRNGCLGQMRRYPEVVDVWLESGAMPFAQWHYPFEEQRKITDGQAYPADFISEGLDQTRGWFYTLLAIATTLGWEAPYRNCLVLGLLVDARGVKMSKRLGNVIEPMAMIDRFGADAVRWLMYTVSQAGDAKRFDPADLDRITRQTLMILWNVLEFWKLYKDQKSKKGKEKMEKEMDQWLKSRLNVLVKETTEKLENYDLTSSARALADFIHDLSTWYIRRSRERFRQGSPEAITILRETLLILAKLLAPFTPFLAEHLYREVGGVLESVHLETWPETDEIDSALLLEMETVRQAAELGHALREEKKIRVRQPLSHLEVISSSPLRPELLQILAAELNVKKITLTSAPTKTISYVSRSAGNLTLNLNFELTPELKHEGWQREIIRHLNELRKETGLTIHDQIRISYDTDDLELLELLQNRAAIITQGAWAADLVRQKNLEAKELLINDRPIRLQIIKIV